MLTLWFFVLPCASATCVTAQVPQRQPLDVARVLAARYPGSPIMSYIAGVAWSSALRLAVLTGDEKWRN